jgi:hypothetical protein
MNILLSTMPTTLFQIEVLFDCHKKVVVISAIEVYVLVDNKCHGIF